MYEWFNKILMHWPVMLVCAVTDYATVAVSNMIGTSSPMINSVVGGANFVAKTAAYQTSYFQSGSGGIMGGSWFGGNGASPSNIPTAAA